MYSLILHGRRFVELKKLRNLRFVVNISQNESAFCNCFSSAAAVADVSRGKGKNFTVAYLVDSLGFTTKLAESISRKVSSEGKANPHSVLSLFRSYGFTDSHISSIIRACPRLLMADAERSLAPKLQFLQLRGASTSELTEILSKVPKILGLRWQKAIGIHYDFVKEIIEADKSSKSKKLCHPSLPQGSAQENKIRNISALRELGVPQRLLFRLLISNLGTVFGKEKFEDTINKVVGMGFDPATFKFIKALCVVYQMSNKTIEEKANVFKSVGFDVEDVWEIFKKNPSFMTLSEKNTLNSVKTFLGLGFTKDEVMMMVKSHPQCLNYSTDSVKKKTEFVVKKMNWPLQSLVSHPQVLGYNMENRTVPRCKVIKALMSKDLLGRNDLPPMPSVLSCNDHVFLNRYVTKLDDKELVRELKAIITAR